MDLVPVSVLAVAALEQRYRLVIDILILPALGLTVGVYFLYIWFAWLRKESNRALRITDMEDDQSGSSGLR